MMDLKIRREDHDRPHQLYVGPLDRHEAESERVPLRSFLDKVWTGLRRGSQVKGTLTNPGGKWAFSRGSSKFRSSPKKAYLMKDETKDQRQGQGQLRSIGPKEKMIKLPPV